MRVPPARLHVLLARQAPVGLVIRHGSAKSVCTLLWDRKRDRFTLGQWMRGRIEPALCDLSPDGKFFLYHASRYQLSANATVDWTVVSHPPYLKAIAYYPADYAGGRFLGNTEYALLNPHPDPEDRESPGLAHRVPEPGLNNLPLYAARLEAAGWGLADGYRHRLKFVREVGVGWELWHEPHRYQQPPYRLLRPDSGRVAPTGDWDWADLDGKRLVWAARGCLWAARLNREGLEGAKLLHDFNAMRFEQIVAPYPGGALVRLRPPEAQTGANPSRKPVRGIERKKPPRGRLRDWDEAD